MVSLDLKIFGTKELAGQLMKMVTLVDKNFKPRLTKALAEEGAVAIRRRLKPRRFRGNVLLAGVFSKSAPGGSADLIIRGDAAWFEEGVRRHPVSLMKARNEPLLMWARAKGLSTTRKGRPRRFLWVHTPRMRLSQIAENRIRTSAPNIARKEWNKSMGSIGK